MGQIMGKFTLFQYNNKDTEMTAQAAAGTQSRTDTRMHFLFLFFVLTCALLCSCSTIKGTARDLSDSMDEFVNTRGGRTDYDFGQGMRMYKEAGIYTGEIVTRVHPTANLKGKPTALFVPLGLVQNSPKPLPRLNIMIILCPTVQKICSLLPVKRARII